MLKAVKVHHQKWLDDTKHMNAFYLNTFAYLYVISNMYQGVLG